MRFGTSRSGLPTREQIHHLHLPAFRDVPRRGGRSEFRLGVWFQLRHCRGSDRPASLSVLDSTTKAAMPTEPWPCWTCRYKSDKATSAEYSCLRPTSSRVSIPEAWVLKYDKPRALGTEKQLRGESQNERPECAVVEPLT